MESLLGHRDWLAVVHHAGDCGLEVLAPGQVSEYVRTRVGAVSGVFGGIYARAIVDHYIGFHFGERTAGGCLSDGQLEPVYSSFWCLRV